MDNNFQQVSFWPDDEENGGSELTMNSQLRKTRSMDSSCLELRLGPSPGNSTLVHHGGPPHLPPALSRARSEANLHASSLSLGPGLLRKETKTNSITLRWIQSFLQRVKLLSINNSIFNEYENWTLRVFLLEQRQFSVNGSNFSNFNKNIVYMNFRA